MNRLREIIGVSLTVTSVLAVLLFAASLSAGAQQVKKIHRVGLIFTTSPVSEMVGPEPVHPSARAFVQGLRALGYVEGQNLILERRSAEGRFERFGEIISELVRVKADAIEAPGDLIPRAAMAITTTVPIVMTTSTDPVREGLVQSLARPGGNITGLTLTPGPETEAKRLELLREHGEPRPHRIELAALRAASSYGAFDGTGQTRSGALSARPNWEGGLAACRVPR